MRGGVAPPPAPCIRNADSRAFLASDPASGQAAGPGSADWHGSCSPLRGGPICGTARESATSEPDMTASGWIRRTGIGTGIELEAPRIAIVEARCPVIFRRRSNFQRGEPGSGVTRSESSPVDGTSSRPPRLDRLARQCRRLDGVPRGVLDEGGSPATDANWYRGIASEGIRRSAIRPDGQSLVHAPGRLALGRLSPPRDGCVRRVE
jgi:hypothetical protein